MAKLDFPSSPTDGQVYAAPNGTNYTWNDTIGVWTAKVAEPLNLTNSGYISGTPQVGQTLAYEVGSAIGGVAPYVYTWTWKKASDDSILQTDGATYVVPFELIGDNVYVELVVTDSLTDTDSGVTNVFPSGTTISAASFPNSNFLPVGAPNASPPEVSTATLHGTGTCDNWQDGFTTLFSTDGILFSVNGGAFGTGGTNISDGDTVDVIWDTATVAAALDGQVLTGTLSDGTNVNVYTLTVTRGAVTGLADFVDLADQPLSTAVTSDVVTPEGFNVPVTLSFAGDATNPLTTIGVSVDGGAFSASPQTVNPGQTLQLQGTTGAANSTAYGVDISMGSPVATDSWLVTTTAVTPTISQPSITSPANGATDINPAVNSPAGIQLVGSTYTSLNGAGDPQTSSTWEVYKDSFPLTSTNAITSVTQSSGSWSSATLEEARRVSPPVRDPFTVVKHDANTYMWNSGTGGGTFSWMKTTDGGANWSLIGALTSSYSQNPVKTNTGRIVYTNGGGGFGNVGLMNSDGNSQSTTSAGGIGNVLWGIDHNPATNTVIITGQGSDGGGTRIASRSTDDGSSWTPIASLPASWPSGSSTGYVYFFNNVWVVIHGAGNGYWYSTDDGVSFTSGTFPTGYSFIVPAGDKAYFYNGSTSYYTTTDGQNFSGPTTLSLPAGVTSLAAPCYLPSLGSFLATGSSNTAEYLTSSDFTTWSVASASPYAVAGEFYLGTCEEDGAAMGGTQTPDQTSLIFTKNAVPTTILTIAGCQTDGFQVDDTIVSNPAAAGPATITAVDNSNVTVVPQSASWAIGQNIERDSSTYSVVTGSPFTVSSAPFTSLDIAESAFSSSSTYYARVQYATTNATAATSDYSPWSEFSTASNFAPDIGGELGGGYYAGQINDGGTIYNLIVAPIREPNAGLEGQYGGTGPRLIRWKTVDSSDTPVATAQNEVYGQPATTTFGVATYPVFDWCVNTANGPNAGTYDATNSVGTGINGYNDWYIPAKNELAVLFFFLKPNIVTNNANSGSNPNSVEPYTPNTLYGPGFPDQTTSTLFQTGGAEAFDITYFYWSATESSDAPSTAWRQIFTDGQQNYTPKSDENSYARAIRRQLA